jgi:hypothetical protein
MEGQLDAGPCIRAFALTNGKRRVVVAWSEAPDTPMTATICGAESTMDWQGNPGPEIEQQSYSRNKIVLDNTPTYIFCNLDGLDVTIP